MARRQDSEPREKESARGTRQQGTSGTREARAAAGGGQRQQQSGRQSGQQSGQMSGEQSGRTSGEQSGQPSRARATPADRERGLSVQRDEGAGATASRESRRAPAQGSGALALASPFEMMRRLTEDMDRLAQGFGLGRLGLLPFAGAGRDPWAGSQPLERTVWSPQIEMLQRGDRLVVRADLPGLERDDVSVEITDDNVLTITGERRAESEDRDEQGFYRSERSYGRFVRTLPLPDGVDASACDATFRNGVLEVTVPLPSRESRARRIDVKG